MRTAYISDIHGNIEALNAVVEDILSRGIKNIVVLGDVVGYGPNPGEVLDKLEELVNTKGLDVRIIPGNHDPAFREDLDNRIQNKPKKKPAGVGQDADDAIERQIETIFTTRTADFFSGEMKKEILRNNPPKYPPTLPGNLKKGFEDKISREKKESPWYSSLRRFWQTIWPWAREKWVVAQHGSHAHAEALGTTFEAAAYIAMQNPEIVEHLKALEKAHKRRSFLESIANGKPHITVNGVDCFHSNWTGGVQYLLDQFQGPIFNSCKIFDRLDLTEESILTWQHAVDAAKKLGKGKVRFGKGHTHIPSIKEENGLILFDTGTVGWPRVPYLNGRGMHNVATYVIQESPDKFEHVYVEYKGWKNAAEKLEAIAEERELPVKDVANSVWYQKMHPQLWIPIMGENGKETEFNPQDYELPKGKDEPYAPPTPEEAAAEAAVEEFKNETDLGRTEYVRRADVEPQLRRLERIEERFDTISLGSKSKDAGEAPAGGEADA